jgi:hypothetical protein
MLSSPASQQEDTNKDKWLLYKVSISDSSILYRVGHALPSTAFSISPNGPSIPADGEGEEPALHALLPTTNLLFSSLKPAVLCVCLSVYKIKIGEGGPEFRIIF